MSFDFERENFVRYDFSDLSYPGIGMIFLDNPTKKKVLFIKAKKNAWLELETFFRYGNIVGLEELIADIEGPNKYPLKDFIFKVIVSDPAYENPRYLEAIYNEIKTDFQNQYKGVGFYRD